MHPRLICTRHVFRLGDAAIYGVFAQVQASHSPVDFFAAPGKRVLVPFLSFRSEGPGLSQVEAKPGFLAPLRNDKAAHYLVQGVLV